MGEVKAGGIRQSVIAGSWYPGQPDVLRRTLEGYLADAEKVELEGELKALISPHAGYAYSGPTAAYAYKQLEDGPAFETVAVLSPLHQAYLGRFAVTKANYYETPLGLVEVDARLVEALDKEVTLNRVGFDGEHSLEIQLPFLQQVLGTFTLLPVMLGEPLTSDRSLAAGRELSAALAKLLRDRKALIVASTDLSHLYDYDKVIRHDRVMTELVKSFDIEGLAQALMEGRCHACGGAPVVTALLTAQALGANRATVLHYTNSGDVTGNRRPGSYTVGYMAAAVYQA
ncbi:MAG: AmmeMemoRadiSam system protein B [Anaerolineales bacterium]|nr:AmmeMemoRadiSam system protein B [Anaerolineales bacterium]